MKRTKVVKGMRPLLREGIQKEILRGAPANINNVTEVALARRAINYGGGAPPGSLSDTMHWASGGIYNVLAYGALGDDSGDTIAEWVVGGAHFTAVNRGKGFADLAAIQAYFPHATALTDTIDWVAIQAAVNAAEEAGGGTVFFPPGAYQINQTITIDTNAIYLVGGGMSASTIRLVANVDGVHVYANHTVIQDLRIMTDGLRNNTTTGIVVGGGQRGDDYGYRLASHTHLLNVRVSGNSSARDLKYGVRWRHGPYLYMTNVDLWYADIGLYGDAWNVDNNHGVINFYALACNKWGMLLEYGKYWSQYTITYGSLSGTFEVGETITGGTSGATGIIKTDGSGTMTLYNSSITDGTRYFTAGETITGATSSATATVSTADGASWRAGTTSRNWENDVIPSWSLFSNHCRENQFINCKTFQCGTDGDWDTGGYRIDSEDNWGYLFGENGVGGSGIAGVRELWLTPESRGNMLYAPTGFTTEGRVVMHGIGDVVHGRNNNNHLQWRGMQFQSFQLRNPPTIGYLEYTQRATNTFDSTAHGTGNGTITERRRVDKSGVVTIFQRHLYDNGTNVYELSSTDLGSNVPGPQMRLGKNTSGSGIAGTVRAQAPNGTFYYLWVDNSMKWRTHHFPPGITSRDISAIDGDGATVTVTTTGQHGFLTGDNITIAGTISYDGTYAITVTTSVSFTFASAATGEELLTGTAHIQISNTGGTILGTQS